MTSNGSSSSALSEDYIQDAFHNYLKSSLRQAKAERLLDEDILSSAEGDLMITGPALCLYFAALRCTTNPPSVPLPRKRMKSTDSSTSVSSPNGSTSKASYTTSSGSTQREMPIDLSPENCPPAFRGFLSTWSSVVPHIQSMPPEHQHDLARVICNLPPLLPPLASNPDVGVGALAQRLRAVAIEISQRRSFQDRYAGDLQDAIDGTGSRKASFVPPPMYTPSPSPSPQASPARNQYPLPTSSPPRSPTWQEPGRLPEPQPFVGGFSVQAPPALPLHPHHQGYAPSEPSGSHLTVPQSPTSAAHTLDPNLLPAITLIRETLYASLADVLQMHALSLAPLLHDDSPRAYFASVGLAILDVSMNSMVWEGEKDRGHAVGVRGVMGKPLTLELCPEQLKPFMRELCLISEEATAWREKDDELAIAALREGHEPRMPRMDKVRDMLIHGAYGSALESSDSSRRSSVMSNGGSRRGRTPSPQGRTLAFVNRVSALALGMTRLRAFRERQEEVFTILKAVMGL
ncbi:hypothetical protein CYLTODRAFT_489006 [Cylindrobasidium torrendii FP15055 ss-10]|uniref:Uncharacterized protein n=1 Tax=Cylindrobasidium torrendii FP15055 ss-10 TaxID=1314674 RepID=A0A0D7BI25_9AGAR|nr:hypothetical protein CYLTODRAFT_489006 [Cylindrobasidium torrendii FP15055 ss-10]